MRRFLACTLGLALCAASAAAQEAQIDRSGDDDAWVYVRFADGAMAWNVEAEIAYADGRAVEGRRLIYFDTPRVYDDQTITWVQDEWRIDCPSNTMQVRDGEELNADLKAIYDIRPAGPYTIREGSTDYYLKQVHCDKRTIEGAKKAENFRGVVTRIVASDATQEG